LEQWNASILNLQVQAILENLDEKPSGQFLGLIVMSHSLGEV
jgi:hypothetical protein